MKRKTVSKNWKWIALLLALSLQACTTPLPPSAVNCPQLPQMPRVSTPIPPVLFSMTAKQSMQSWQQRLTGSLPNGKP